MSAKRASDVDREATDVNGIPVVVADHDTAPFSGFHLRCVIGPDLGKSFALQDLPLTIGRAGGVQLRATDVSRAHARITQRHGRFWIEDLNSTNGTFVNNVPVTQARKLSIGDHVQIGSATLVFTRNNDLEEHLRRLERLEALNALAKGLAHDFNNTLQVLLCGIGQLQCMAPSDEMQTVLDEMVQASTSATDLVRRILRVGRNEPETLSPVDIDDVVRTSVAMAQRVLPANVRVTVVGEAHVHVRGSRSELAQALLNILLNARDAMPRGGTVAIASSVIELDRPTAHARRLAGEGSFVEIAIRDDGCGMDDEQIARAFEPYFTTKAGKGTGLGLAMVYGTATGHGGVAAVESKVGVGTTVRITLPVAP